MSDPMKIAKDTVSIVGELIKTAGDNPDVKAAGQNLGKAALTITKTINNALLPLAAVNFAFDKARVYFSDKFQNDLSEKASKILQENIVEPKASIAGPALQGLAFTHDEPSLKDMYLSLLATAMNSQTTNNAHPAFVEIIKQLDSEEASLLRDILRATQVPVAEIRRQTEGQSGWIPLHKHLINVTRSKTKNPVEHSGIAAMIDNWIRLGLVEVDYSKHINDDSSYSWVEKRPEYIKYKTSHEKDSIKVKFQKGVLLRTALGAKFALAVGLIN
jgi:hypothetical protein